MTEKTKKFKVAVLTGGPSLERGISLNSARSVLDHLDADSIEVVPIYFDIKKKAYKISKAQLYSNTPSDFDFKLANHAKELNNTSLVKLLKSVDIVFPAMHGAFGEDGEIQKFLEKHNVPFVGSGSKSCKEAFDKHNSNQTLSQNGFHTLPSALLKIYSSDNEKVIKEFFKKNKIDKAIVKPATSGSSIGVFTVHNPKEALEKANIIFSKRMDTRVVLEPFATGREFTVIVLQNKLGLPVALLPSEIEMTYHEGRIFDFRKKYLPTNQVKYHCPPRFSEEVINNIRVQASQIFSLFGMKDFARFDGWLMPDGNIWFSDFNTISGMEQNSFLFQQSSRIGMSHGELLRFVIKNSAQRQGVKFNTNIESKKNLKRKPVSVLFGGDTSERQVSLMSGTNVWLKLKKSKIYEPIPHLLGFKGEIWKLPYALILNHTVEEILDNVKEAKKNYDKVVNMVKPIKEELMLEPGDATEDFFRPEQITMEELIDKSKFIFLGLHGGAGENGTIQAILEKNKVKHNGSNSHVSRLCMDKWDTGEFIRKAKIKGLSIAEQAVYTVKELEKLQNVSAFWRALKAQLGANTVIVKPKDDGCSTGVAHLFNERDLMNYLQFLFEATSFIPVGTLTSQDAIVEMPTTKLNDIMFEKFIYTDKVRVVDNKIKHKKVTGWVEVTVGLFEHKGKYHALNPSITIAEGEVLSLEEKFQGGTGVNLTPPPGSVVKQKAIKKTKKLIEELAQKIGLTGYARIDAFMNIQSGELLVIEVNTLPGLTPSTVLYHQGLAEKKPLYPKELLETIIQNAEY